MDEMACYTIKSDGTDGCRVAFLAKEYAAGDRGLRWNGAIVRIIDVYLSDNPNRMARHLYHHNLAMLLAKLSPFLGHTTIIYF